MTTKAEYLRVTQEFERAQKKWEKTRNKEDWKRVRELMDKRLVLYDKIVERIKQA